MGDDLPTVETLQAEHDRLEAKLRRLGELVGMLEEDEGFAELDRLAQTMKADMDRHFPAEEALTRQLFGEGDAALTELCAQHAALKTHYRTLLALIQDVRDDMPVDRELFMTTVRAVMAQLRAQLDTEQRLLLPRLRKG